MKSSSLWASALHFLFATILACFGLFCVQLSFYPVMQGKVFSLLQNPGAFLYLGVGGLAFSLFLFVSFYFLHKKTYYQLKMKPGCVDIDSSLIQGVMEKFFAEKMPLIPVELEVSFANKKEMHVVAHVPSSLQEPFYRKLHKCEKALQQELFRVAGYQGSWTLTVFSV
jgi:hypothetical protein